MTYCSNCGHPQDGSLAAPAESPESPEVKIARIQAERDIKVAQITARIQREELDTAEAIAETEADAEVTAAVAEAEIVGAALEAGAIQPEPPAPPVIIDSDISADSDADASEELPPAEGSPAPEPSASKRVGLGMW